MVEKNSPEEESSPKITRRQFIAGGAVGVASALVGFGLGRSVAPAREIIKEVVKEVEKKGVPFTEWGWPLPYTKISESSIAFLKERKWWPLKIGYQPVWVDAGVNFFLLKSTKEGGIGPLENRGLQAEIVPFWAGAPLNEAFLGGVIQGGVFGEFPWTAMIDKGAPITMIGPWTNPGDTSIMVRKDSPIKEVKELAGKVVAVALISCSENSLRLALMNAGLNPVTAKPAAPNDVQLIHMPIPEQVTFPAGVDAVCPWAFSPEFMLWEKKNARRLLDINDVYPSCYVHRWLHNDILKNAPDVAQAFAEALVEVDLYARTHPKEAARLFVKHEPFVEAYSEYFIYSQVVGQFTKAHPRKAYPFPDLMAEVWGGPVAGFLWKQARTKRRLTEADYRAQIDDKFMKATFEKLGWSIPANCMLLPEGFTNSSMIDFLKKNLESIEKGQTPVKWDTPFTRPFKDPFPIVGDLTKDWYYAGQWYRAADPGKITKTRP